MSDNPLSKTQKYELRIKELLQHHGWKLDVPPSVLPKEDKAGLGGGLRCFRRVCDRDEAGNKKPDGTHRCGNPAKKGSFFCKKHGGGNQHALLHGKSTSATAGAYRGAFKVETGDLFDAFLNDPSMIDLKPELAALRTCLREYVTQVSAEGKKAKNVNFGIKYVKSILNDKVLTKEERWRNVKEYCAMQKSLTDGETLDRILKIVDIIGKLVERIDKIQSREEFLLTPDGIKVIFRCIIDCLRGRVEADTLKLVKEDLVMISTRTQGDISKYQGNNEPKQLTIEKP